MNGLGTLTFYLNGHLHLPPGTPAADAMAIQDGRIIWIGSTAQARDTARHNDVIFDLRGATVWPGLVDSHIHLLWTGLALTQINLEGCASLADAVFAVGQRAQSLPQGTWVHGSGWNRHEWPEGRWPTAADLDTLTPHHPVVLASKDRHVLWVNSKALSLAGISAATDNPPGGEIGRDEHGTPSGVLKENAQALLQAVIPSPTLSECMAAIKAAQELAHSVGLVGCHSMDGADAFAAVQALHAAGDLSLRVLHSIPSASVDHALMLGLRSGIGDDWVRLGGVKVFADGSLGGQTAAMLDPYEGSTNRGILVHEPADLHDIVLRSRRGGLSLTIHAIGDRANRIVLDAFSATYRTLAALSAEEGLSVTRPRLPDRIEHVQLLHLRDLPRLADLGLVASMQPIHCTSDRDMAYRYWGNRSIGAYAFRDLLVSGAVLAFGSDAPVESCNPFLGLHAAMTGDASGVMRLVGILNRW